jgi:hypothetical protein
LCNCSRTRTNAACFCGRHRAWLQLLRVGVEMLALSCMRMDACCCMRMDAFCCMCLRWAGVKKRD